jgi:hypothetical protein
MPTYNASKLFASPKKRGRPSTKKTRACAPKVPFNECASKKANCTYIYYTKIKYIYYTKIKYIKI